MRGQCSNEEPTGPGSTELRFNSVWSRMRDMKLRLKVSCKYPDLEIVSPLLYSLPSKAVEFPSLEIFKSSVDTALRTELEFPLL